MRPRFPWQHLLVLLLWLSLLLAFWSYAQTRERGALELVQSWLASLSERSWGPLALLGIFALRPLLLLPITILNVFSGFLFGPLLGLLYALLATLMSSSVAYAVGRFFGRLPKEAAAQAGFVRGLRSRSFESIVTGRLMFVPGDLINYPSGFWRIPYAVFLLATALGGLPGLMISVFAGASLEGPFRFEGVRVNAWYLLVSAALLVGSLSLSYTLRRRRARKAAAPER